MPKLTPVDYDPFSEEYRDRYKLTPVDYDPFEEEDEGRRSIGGLIKDTGISLTQSAMAFGSGVAWLADMIVRKPRYYVPEDQPELESYNEGRGPGILNDLSNYIAEQSESLDQYKTPQMQESWDELHRVQSESDGFIDGAIGTFKALVADPKLIGDMIAKSAVFTLPIGVASRAAYGAKVAQGAGRVAATRAAATAGAITEGALEGADAGSSVMREIMQMTPEELMANSSMYPELAERYGHEGAIERLADRAGISSALITAPIAALAGKLSGAAGAEAKFFTGQGIKDLGKTVLSEASQEIVQEGSNQLSQNITQRVFTDRNQGLLDDVGSGMVMGAITGGVQGGAMRVAGDLVPPVKAAIQARTKTREEGGDDLEQEIAAAGAMGQAISNNIENTPLESLFEDFDETAKDPGGPASSSLLPEQFRTTSTPPVLQNRDRSTPAMIQQMLNVSSDPDYSRLGFSRDFTSGAPVVEPGVVLEDAQLGKTDFATVPSTGRRIPIQYAVVEADQLITSNRIDGAVVPEYQTGVEGFSRAIAGNGRIAGLKSAFEKKTTKSYVDEMMQDASMHGVSPGVISGMERPVLVRIMPQDQITSNIGDESNTPGVATLSTAETARNDSRRVDFTAVEITEDGRVTPQAVRQFIQQMPESEQNGMINAKDGQPNQAAIKRFEDALFWNAYESESLLNLKAEATEGEAANIINALKIAAPGMSRLKGAGEYDIRSLVVEAAEIAVNARRSGTSLAEYIKQVDIDQNPAARPIVEMMAENVRSAKKIGDSLSRLQDLMYTESGKPEEDMMGPTGKRSGEELLGELYGRRESTQDPGIEGRPSPAQGNNGGQTAIERSETGAAAGTQDAEFALETQSEESLRQQAEQLAQAEQARQDAIRKADADDQLGDFTLSGSSRPVDQAEARGQRNMFDAPTTKPAPESNGEKVPPSVEFDRTSIERKYREANYKEGQGSMEGASIEASAKKAADIAQKLQDGEWRTAAQLTRRVQRKSSRGAAEKETSRLLKFLRDSGDVQIAYDEEGNAYHAAAGKPLRDGLMTEAEASARWNEDGSEKGELTTTEVAPESNGEKVPQSKTLADEYNALADAHDAAFKPGSKIPLPERVSLNGRARKAQIAAAQAISDEGKPVAFRNGNVVEVITPSAQEDGRWQVTRWNETGALGDSQYNSFEDAVNDIPLGKKILSEEETTEVVSAGAMAESARTDLDSLAHEAATSPNNDLPQPTDGQKEAGNYKKGHIKVLGMDVSIENPQGSTRSGTDPDGNAWENEMSHHYGYIKRTQGADGDQIDTYVGPNPASEKVFVVDQVNRDGSFDEHKVMLGFDSKADAVKGYKSNYSKGFKVGPVTEMTAEEFKSWVKDGDNSQPIDQSLRGKPRQETDDDVYTVPSYPKKPASMSTGWAKKKVSSLLKGEPSINKQGTVEYLSEGVLPKMFQGEGFQKLLDAADRVDDLGTSYRIVFGVENTRGVAKNLILRVKKDVKGGKTVPGKSMTATYSEITLDNAYPASFDGEPIEDFLERQDMLEEAWAEPEDDVGRYDEEKDWDYEMGSFPEPEKTVNLRSNPPKVLSAAEAHKVVKSWKDAAKQDGETQDNSRKVIISLFDESGNITQPWKEAGYHIEQVDIKLGDDILMDTSPLEIRDRIESVLGEDYEIYAILAQPPCTTFTNSSTRWRAERHDKHDRAIVNAMFGPKAADYFSKPKEYTKALASMVDLYVALYEPQITLLENPVGRIAQEMGLPEPTLRMNPHNFGDPYTKQTDLWGNFNPDLPTANVDPVQGSLMHKLWSSAEKGEGLRSKTPMGFAYAFYMANRAQESSAGVSEQEAGYNDIGEVSFDKWETGKPVTFNYIHNTESATSTFGVPDKDSPYGRGYEPSGRYVVEGKPDPKITSLVGGELTFNNPLVIDNDGLQWKKKLSDRYGGKTGKELSKALIADGYDGVVTVEVRGGKPSYVSEILDLTTFDESVAVYEQPSEYSAENSMYVAHNLSAENLLHAEELGGLAMPSLAVGDANVGVIDGFGEITLLADKEILNSPNTKTFDADIYSPRYPSVNYDIDYSGQKALLSAVEKSREEMPFLRTTGYLDLELDGARALKEDDAFMYHFLKERGSRVLKYRNADGSINEQKTRETIRQRVETGKLADEFEDYVNDKYNSIVSRRRIFNGYTNSGNRRYLDYNLENIVKLMGKELRGGEGFNYGAGSVRSSVANQIKGPAQAKKRQGQIVSSEEMSKIRDESNSKLMEALDKLRPYYKFDSSAFGYLDDASDAIRTNTLREAFEVNDEVRKIVADLRDYLKNLPTEYFEAKVQRQASLDEFSVAIVPRGTRKRVIDVLKKYGLKVRYYEKGNQESRRQAVLKEDAMLFEQQSDYSVAQDERSEYDQAVAKGLDMSEEARLQRARAMGFDEEIYYKGMHPYDWTKETDDSPGPEITEINRTTDFPSFGGEDGDVAGIAGFLTKDPKIASRFANNQGAVYPLRYRQGDVYEIDAAGKKAGEIQFGESGKEFRDAARSGDYDTILIRNTSDEGDIYVALKSNNIRSINAAFDPDYEQSGNLLRSRRGRYDNENQLAFDYETRPTESAEEEQNLDRAKRAAVRTIRYLRGIEGSVLGSAIAKDFTETSTASLVGQEVKGTSDLAALAQIYRNPQFETLRAFFTKDGKVVAQTAVSSRMPGFSGGFPMMMKDGKMQNPQTMDEGASFYRKIAEKSGADGFYLMHNHPSGNPTPSTADLNFTGGLVSRLPGLKFNGHIVLNHKSYAVIDGKMKGEGKFSVEHWIEQMPEQDSYDIGSPSVKNDLLDIRMKSPADVVNIAKALEGKGLVLIGTRIDKNIESRVNAIATLPENFLSLNRVKQTAALRKFARTFGATRMFVVGAKVDPAYRNAAIRAIKYDLLTDVLFEDGVSARMETPHAKPVDGYTLGAPNSSLKAALTQEDVAGQVGEAAGQYNSKAEWESSLSEEERQRYQEIVNNKGVGRENSSKTARNTTTGSYIKAANVLRQSGVEGQILDFGSGLGLGTQALGPDAISYDPFPNLDRIERAGGRAPDHTDASKIPADSMNGVVSLNVLNVVDQAVRDDIVRNIGRVLAPGGSAVVSTRAWRGDVDNALSNGVRGWEPNSVVTSEGTFQRGFSSPELAEYVGGVLGDGFTVETLQGIGGAAVKIQKSEPSFVAEERSEYEQAVEKGLDMSEEARLQRARAMGFDTDTVWYHGSLSNDVTEFEIGRPKNWNTVGDAEAVYFTDDRQRASVYRREKGKGIRSGKAGKVYSVYVNTENFLDITEDIRNRPEGMTFGDAKREALKKVDETHPGAIFRGDDYNSQELIVFDTSKIRSVDAAFDPDFKDSSNLVRSQEGEYQASPTRQGDMITPEREIDESAGAGRTDDMLADRPIERTVVRNVDSLIDRFRFYTQDKLIDLRRQQERAGPLADQENPYQKAEIWEGKAAERLEQFEEKRVEPVLAAIARAGYTIDEVGNYLVARHAAEANAYLADINPDRPANERYRLSGMSDQEAQVILRQYQNDQQMKDIAKAIDRINRERLNVLVNEGLIDRITAQAWKSRYKFYVPLMREEAMDEDYLPPRGQGFSIRGRESKARVGSTLTPGKILENVFAQYEMTLIRAEKNKVGKALANFIENNPNPDFFYIDDARAQARVQNHRVIQGRKFTLADNELSVKVNGIERVIVFNKSNPAAMRLVAGMKNLTPVQANLAVKGLASVTRFLATINTSWNPEFLVSNFARDIQTAGYNLESTDLAGAQMRVAKDVIPALNGIRNAMWGDGSSDWAQVWEDFKLEGGKTGWIDLHSSIGAKSRDLNKAIERLQAGKPRKSDIERLALKINEANTIIENGVRLAAYKNAIGMGLSKQQAAALAKNLTVNFNKKGQLGPTINALYMFYNASIQGSARLLSTMVKSSRGRKLALATVAFAAALDMLNRALSGDDDDGENIYDNLPDYVKNHNIMLMWGDQPIIKVPAPYGYNVLHIIGQAIGELATGERFDPVKAGVRVAVGIADAFNPVGSSTLLQTLTPTILDPVAQIRENKNFTGLPLKPEHTFDVNVPRPEYQMHFSNVRDASRNIAEWLNDISGGNEIRAGKLNISPEWIDLIVDQVTGGAGRTVSDSLDFVGKLISGDELEMSRIPFARKVTGYDSREYGVRNRYYEWTKEVATVKAELKAFRGAERREAFRNPARKMIALYDQTERQLTRLRDIRDRRLADGNEEGADQTIERMRTLMARFNERYAEVVLDSE